MESKQRLNIREHYEALEKQGLIRIIPSDTEGGLTIVSFHSAEQKQVDEKEHTVVHLISTPRIDYVMDVMDPFGYRDDALRKNRAVFYNHSWSGPGDLPIGKNLWLRATKEGVLAKTKYAVEEYGFAGDVFRLVMGDYLNSFSIGWNLGTVEVITIKTLLDIIAGKFEVPNATEYPMEEKVWYHSQWGIHEYSQVGIPMNQDAVKGAIAKAMAKDVIRSDYGRAYFGSMIGREQIVMPDGIPAKEEPKAFNPLRDRKVGIEKAEVSGIWIRSSCIGEMNGFDLLVERDGEWKLIESNILVMPDDEAIASHIYEALAIVDAGPDPFTAGKDVDSLIFPKVGKVKADPEILAEVRKLIEKYAMEKGLSHEKIEALGMKIDQVIPLLEEAIDASALPGEGGEVAVEEQDPEDENPEGKDPEKDEKEEGPTGDTVGESLAEFDASALIRSGIAGAVSRAKGKIN